MLQAVCDRCAKVEDLADEEETVERYPLPELVLSEGEHTMSSEEDERIEVEYPHLCTACALELQAFLVDFMPESYVINLDEVADDAPAEGAPE